MTFLLVLAIWLALGMVTLAASVWIDPDKFDANARAKKHSEHFSPLYLDGERFDVAWRSTFTVALWPVAIVYLAIELLLRVLLRSKREKLKLRDEMEKELASARREVEDLLRSARK